jgi:hypothetical protein
MRKGLTFEFLAGIFTVCAAALVCGLLLTAHVRPHHDSELARAPATGTLEGLTLTPASPAASPAATGSPLAQPANVPSPNTPNRANPSDKPTSHSAAGQSAPPSPTATPATPRADQPPNVVLAVSQTAGPVPLTITVDASQSTDGDGTPIANMVFDFGDGTSQSPAGGTFAVTHTYAVAGTYTLSVTAIDTAGHQKTVSLTITARLV